MDPIVKNGNLLRWKFENVKDLNSKGAISDKFDFKSLDWTISICPRKCEDKKYLGIYLHCDSQNKEKNWICQIDGKFRILKQGGDGTHVEGVMDSCFHEDIKGWGYGRSLTWESLMLEDNGYLKNGGLMVEFDFNFKYYDFSKSKSDPSFTDITINVEDTDFHLNKWALISRSKFFHEMMMNSKPKDTDFLQIYDVRAKDFCYMLASFYPFFEIDQYSNYEELIKLADRFDVPSLHHKCEQYLIKNSKIKLIDKIMYADENDYEKLMKECLNSLKSGLEVKMLMVDQKFLKLRFTTQSRIMRRGLEFL